MKILFVHDTFGALAGAEQNIIVSGQALQERGNELSFLYSHNTHKDEDKFLSVFKNNFQIDFLTQYPSDKIYKITQFINIINPDIIYVHKIKDLSILEQLFRFNKPLVRMVHDHDIYCQRTYRYNYFTRRPCRKKAGLCCYFPCFAFAVRNRNSTFPIKLVSLSNKLKEIDICKKFDKLFVISNYMKEELLTQGFDENKITIHPPAPQTVTNTIESNFSAKNIILYIGQIIRGKGLDCLLHSVSKLTTPFQLLVIGAGNYEHYCKELAKKLKVEDKVQFLGWISHDQISSYYKEASLVVVPSVWPEPFGMIGLEVMRYKLPVVAFNSGGIPDWLIDGKNGYLVDWKDTEGMTAAITKLLNNKDVAKQMGNYGYDYVNRNYSFDKYIDSIQNAFKDLSAKTS